MRIGRESWPIAAASNGSSTLVRESNALGDLVRRVRVSIGFWVGQVSGLQLREFGAQLFLSPPDAQRSAKMSDAAHAVMRKTPSI